MCQACGGPCHHDTEEYQHDSEQGVQPEEEQPSSQQPQVEEQGQGDFERAQFQAPLDPRGVPGQTNLTSAENQGLPPGWPILRSQPVQYGPRYSDNQPPFIPSNTIPPAWTPYGTPVPSIPPPVTPSQGSYVPPNIGYVTRELTTYGEFHRGQAEILASGNRPRSSRPGYPGGGNFGGFEPRQGGRRVNPPVRGSGGTHTTSIGIPPRYPGTQTVYGNHPGEQQPGHGRDPGQRPPELDVRQGPLATPSSPGVDWHQRYWGPQTADLPGTRGPVESPTTDPRVGLRPSSAGTPGYYPVYDRGEQIPRPPRITSPGGTSPFVTGVHARDPTVREVQGGPQTQSSPGYQPRRGRHPPTGVSPGARSLAGAQDPDDEGGQVERAQRHSSSSSSEDIELGADRKPKGQTRVDPANGLQFWDPNNSIWVDAVYHDEIRGALLQAANSRGQYLYPRQRGPEPLDETAFHGGQSRWGIDRPAGWNNIPDRILTRLERRGYEPGPPYDDTEPGYMRHRGRVVIDSDNRPIIDWPILPVTLSSQYEGAFMEAVRRICRGVQPRDFWARMPQPRAGKKVGLTALTNRQKKFRDENGLISWTGRGGSDKFKQAVMDQLDPRDRANNTTENFEGLGSAALKAAKEKNKGSAASRSKSKTHQERIQRQRAEEEKRKQEEREARARQEALEGDEEEEGEEEHQEEEGEQVPGDVQQGGLDADSEFDSYGDTDDEPALD